MKRARVRVQKAARRLKTPRLHEEGAARLVPTDAAGKGLAFVFPLILNHIGLGSYGRGRLRKTKARVARISGSVVSVWNEHIADTPDGLDVAWHGGVGLDQLAQARDLHVQAAVKGLELAAARQLRQLFA